MLVCVCLCNTCVYTLRPWQKKTHVCACIHLYVWKCVCVHFCFAMASLVLEPSEVSGSLSLWTHHMCLGLLHLEFFCLRLRLLILAPCLLIKIVDRCWWSPSLNFGWVLLLPWTAVGSHTALWQRTLHTTSYLRFNLIFKNNSNHLLSVEVKHLSL